MRSMARSDGEDEVPVCSHRRDDAMSTPVEELLLALACAKSGLSLLPLARKSTGGQIYGVHSAHKALYDHNVACLCSCDCQRC
jgi:hypothetical protein